MATTAEEREIIRRILDHEANGTTDTLPQVMDNPVTHYTDPEQLRQEVAVLFCNYPLAIAHRSEVAEPGDFVTHDERLCLKDLIDRTLNVGFDGLILRNQIDKRNW